MSLVSSAPGLFLLRSPYDLDLRKKGFEGVRSREVCCLRRRLVCESGGKEAWRCKEHGICDGVRAEGWRVQARLAASAAKQECCSVGLRFGSLETCAAADGPAWRLPAAL
eukprot:3941728-Rhodomonas_salina.4